VADRGVVSVTIWWPMAQTADLPGMPNYATLRNWFYRGKLPNTKRCERTNALLVDVAEVQHCVMRSGMRDTRIKCDTLQTSGIPMP
jgi:hypothetical protein